MFFLSYASTAASMKVVNAACVSMDKNKELNDNILYENLM